MRPLADAGKQAEQDQWPGEFVVGQGRMTEVGGEENLIGRVAGQHALGKLNATVIRKVGVNVSVVLAVFERMKLTTRQAKAPGTLVITGDVRNSIGISVDAMEGRLELCQT